MAKRDSHSLLNWAKPVAPTCWEANFASAKRSNHDVLLHAQILGYIHQLDGRLSINPLRRTKIKQLSFCCTDCLDYLQIRRLIQVFDQR